MAACVRRARLRRHALARFRPGAASRRTRRLRQPQAPLRRSLVTLTPLVSRVLVAVVGLPIVLALVYAGGWWLFTLAAVTAVLALHEYALMTRSLRPVTLAAYAGTLVSLLGAELGGLQWTIAGFLRTLVLAVILPWVTPHDPAGSVTIP